MRMDGPGHGLQKDCVPRMTGVQPKVVGLTTDDLQMAVHLGG